MIRRRVAIVLSGFALSGAEKQAMLLAEGLRRDHGREVIVAAFDPGPGVVELCATMGIPTMRLPHPGGRWPWLARLRSRRSLAALRGFAPDAIVPFTLWPNVACILGAGACGSPRVLWNQRDEGLWSVYPHDDLRDQAVSRADAWLANGPAGVAWLEGRGIPAGSVRYVRNGCVRVPSPGRGAARLRLGLAEHAPVAAMLAHESGRKDHETLARAWVAARPRLPSGAVLLVAGRGAFAGLRQQPGVRLLGDVSDPAVVLAATDALVHATRGEGASNAVIEAALAGIPVVASAVAGMADALGPHHVGALVPPGDAESLALALAEVLKAGRDEMRLAAASAWAASAYDPARMVAGFVEAIDAG